MKRFLNEIDFELLLQQVGAYHKHDKALLILDEFQDIAQVPQADAKFRNALQQFSGDLPVIVLGSKKHLLSNLFVPPQAPLAGWGTYLEISSISTKDYCDYINERFSANGRSISVEQTAFLQNSVQNIPEAINIICDRLLRHKAAVGYISNQEISDTLKEVVDERRSLFEEKLARYTDKEGKFLLVMARLEPVAKPMGKAFLQQIQMSPGGSGPLLKRLENEAVIYKTDKGYVVADPLLSYYLRWYR